MKHAHVIDSRSFARWLAIWKDVTDEMFDPESAAALQLKAGRIAESLSLGIQFGRNPRVALGDRSAAIDRPT